MSVAISLTGTARLYLLQPETAIALAFETVGANWTYYILTISAFFGIAAVAFNLLMVSTHFSVNIVELT